MSGVGPTTAGAKGEGGDRRRADAAVSQLYAPRPLSPLGLTAPTGRVDGEDEEDVASLSLSPLTRSTLHRQRQRQRRSDAAQGNAGNVEQAHRQGAHRLEQARRSPPRLLGRTHH